MNTNKSPKWFIRNQATQQRFTEANFPTRSEAEKEIGKILTESKKVSGPTPCLEAVQLLTE